MHYYKPIVYFLYFSVPCLIWFCGWLNYYSDYVHTTYLSEDDQNTVYDFIVVGAGAGGSVVAHRLSTTKNFKVLLLEAGGDPSFVNNIPGIALDLTGYPETDWKHSTVPQKNACWALKNNQSLWNAGKVLGGSTTLNYMFYLRGSPRDFDNWANLCGDEAWSHENVLPFFKKSIKSYNGQFAENSKHYSESKYGFLNIEQRNWLPLFDEFKEAGKQNGFPTMDPNGGSQRTGFAMIESTQKNGQRYGAYASIISQLEKKSNVKVSRYSQVLKVKLDKNLRAEGVWYMQHGVKKFAKARKEVILSAGSVKSPQILMVSGIGPASHLASVGIKPRLNLPVGENLHDHIVAPLVPWVINESLSFLADRDFSPYALYDFAANGKGPLSVPNGLHSQLFYSSAVVQKSGEGDWPDIQGFFSPAGVFELLGKSVTRAAKIREEMMLPLLDPHIGKDGLIILAGLVRPKSRGEVRLQSSDPMSPPLIDPHYLEHPDDVKALVDGIQKIIQVFETSEPFKKLGTRLQIQNFAGCEQYKLRSDAFWECYIRHFTLTIWHPVGTCRMGRGQDKRSVVDTKLRVLQTPNLRVIDASVMPEIVNVNTMGATYMIGEKGSDSIREYWSEQFLVSDLMGHVFYRHRHSKKCYYSQLV